MKSMQVISRVREFGYEVSINDIFKSQTIEALARRLKKIEPGGRAFNLKRAEKRFWYPLASPQKRLYVMQKIMGDTPAIHLQQHCVLSISIGHTRIQEIFQLIVDRHESLRTVFPVLDGNPVQRTKDVKVILEVISIQEYSNPQYSFMRPFDLEQGPLIRVGVVEFKHEKVVLVDVHHIIADGISIGLLIREFEECCTGCTLPPVRYNYHDYSVWQLNARPYMKSQESYWMKQLKGELPKLTFRSMDRMARGSYDDRGASMRFVLSANMTEGLKGLAERTGVSLFSVLIHVASLVLAKDAIQEEIIVGVPVSGRNHRELEGVIGMLVNSVVLRLFPSNHKRASVFLKEVGDTLSNALDNQDFQFDDLVDKLGVARGKRRNPIFNVIMMMQNHQDIISGPDNVAVPEGLLDERVNVSIVNDLFFRFREGKRNFLIDIHYAKDIFSRGLVVDLFRGFITVAETIITDPEITINTIKFHSSYSEAIPEALDADFDL